MGFWNDVVGALFDVEDEGDSEDVYAGWDSTPMEEQGNGPGGDDA